MFLRSNKKQKATAMPNTKSTTSKSKFKPRPLSSVSFQRRTSRSVWPKGMSYNGWKNLSKSLNWFLGKNNKRNRLQKKIKKRFIYSEQVFFTEKLPELNDSIEPKRPLTLIDDLKQEENENVTLELITILKQFLERKNISQHIEKTIIDRRNQDLITYSKQSIMMSALSIFLFRMASGNKYDDKIHDQEKYSLTNMSKFIDSPEDRAPVIKTIEKFLKNLDENSINNLMITFFKDLQRSKFFKQHPEIMPGDFFLLAADCVHTHTYDHPHYTDVNGNNACGCCLKRVYNKGTENEKIRWIHNTLVLCFVFMGGLKIPIYRYPIHARQVIHLEDSSEDNHKQECELVALKISLPIIREAFPKMKIVLLLDGLYANRPVIRLLKTYRCEYIIVRKEASLRSLAKDCDGQAKLPNHRKNCVKTVRLINLASVIEQKYEWFNSVDIGEEPKEVLTTNILRFSEIITKDGEAKSYRGEWLFSWRLSAKTCESSARQARIRWEEEDVFNTLKNRGFNLGHDYSRDPRSCFNWQALAFFAFGVFELFRFSDTVRQRCDLPQITLAEKLQGQLLYRPTQELFSIRCLTIRIQFRYNFSNVSIKAAKSKKNRSPQTSETG